MTEVIISLNVADLDVLKLLVKECVAVWDVRYDNVFTVADREHCLYTKEFYKHLLESLEPKKD